ncbi:MAG: molybdenum cofactor biosynthesis protein MoaE [Verrucomicrobiota bacterium]
MRVSVEIVRVPILLSKLNSGELEIGSIVEFQGLVRQHERGIQIEGLMYEAYESMALKEMEKILEELGKNFSCFSVEVIHRIGWVPVGEASIYVRVCSKHRKEGFELCMRFMDLLKKDVPIWKVDRS